MATPTPDDPVSIPQHWCLKCRRWPSPSQPAFVFTFYLHDHLDGGQRGGDVLRVRRSHRDGHAAGVQAAVKRHDEVDAWRTEREETGGENDDR